MLTRVIWERTSPSIAPSTNHEYRLSKNSRWNRKERKHARPRQLFVLVEKKSLFVESENVKCEKCAECPEENRTTLLTVKLPKVKIKGSAPEIEEDKNKKKGDPSTVKERDRVPETNRKVKTKRYKQDGRQAPSTPKELRSPGYVHGHRIKSMNGLWRDIKPSHSIGIPSRDWSRCRPDRSSRPAAARR